MPAPVRQETRYFIGNIQRRNNGWCYRRHIFGTCVEVQVVWRGEQNTRPRSTGVYAQVKELVEKGGRWNWEAANLCSPKRSWT